MMAHRNYGNLDATESYGSSSFRTIMKSLPRMLMELIRTKEHTTTTRNLLVLGTCHQSLYAYVFLALVVGSAHEQMPNRVRVIPEPVLCSSLALVRKCKVFERFASIGTANSAET